MHELPFKVIVAGGREFNNYPMLKKKLDHLLSNKVASGRKIEIVSGCAKGADSFGEFYAKQKGFPIKEFPANWGKLGRAAGIIRNKEMAEYANALICFWDGKSLGSKNMINIAERLALEVRIKYYK